MSVRNRRSVRKGWGEKKKRYLYGGILMIKDKHVHVLTITQFSCPIYVLVSHLGKPREEIYHMPMSCRSDRMSLPTDTSCSDPFPDYNETQVERHGKSAKPEVCLKCEKKTLKAEICQQRPSRNISQRLAILRERLLWSPASNAFNSRDHRMGQTYSLLQA